jgi:type II secretory pathway pseudopilin PulG
MFVMPYRARGFTIVELGIVLAVVALLAAGLMVAGRAMIRRGEVADLIAKTRDLAAAARAFKGRYGFFPGDLPNAASILASVSTTCNYAAAGFVGDGLVDTATEKTCALEHLVRAGLLDKVSFEGGAYRIPGPEGSSVTLGFDEGSKQNTVEIDNLPCDIALELDAKLDTVSATGTPLADGQVQGRNSVGASLSTCIPGQSNDPVPVLLIRY